MSHLNDFKTQVTDRTALVRALERMGFKGKVKVYDTAKRLNGFHSEDKKFAHVLVTKEHTGIPADIGFEQTADGTFVAHIDDYKYWTGIQYNQAWQNKLYTYYNVEKSKMEFEAHGIEYEELKDEVGRIVVQGKFKQTTEPGKVAVHL